MNEPHLSVIVPVLNEAAEIEVALAALVPLREAGVEVIVVDGGSRDDSVAVAAPWCDHCLSAPRGRARQMNRGAEVATGHWLLFLHIDTRLPADWHEWLTQLTTPGWGFFPVQLSGRAWPLRLIERAMGWRSRLTRVATGDQALYVERSLYAAAGGFPDIPLMEDVAICKQLRQLGAPHIWHSPVRVSSRRWERDGIWRTTGLMWGLRLAYWLGVSPQRLHRWYYGREISFE